MDCVIVDDWLCELSDVKWDKACCYACSGALTNLLMLRHHSPISATIYMQASALLCKAWSERALAWRQVAVSCHKKLSTLWWNTTALQQNGHSASGTWSLHSSRSAFACALHAFNPVFPLQTAGACNSCNAHKTCSTGAYTHLCPQGSLQRHGCIAQSLHQQLWQHNMLFGLAMKALLNIGVSWRLHKHTWCACV